MAELDQFNVENTTSLDAFQDDTQLAPPVTNASSNQNLASHAAMLSPRPDQMADVFNTSMDEYNTQGSSPTAESVITNAKGENAQAYRRASMDFLLDANVSDDWKRNAIGRINDPNSDLYRVRAMVGTQEASKAVPGESQESADMRGVWASSINKVLDFQREKQKFYNEMQLRQDANKAATYVDIAESFIPVTYGYKQSSLANDLSGGTALSTLWQAILPGEAKSTMVEKFNQIPFEQRAAVMQKAMDIIAEHGSTIVLPEESDQANMSIFRDMVESGEYTLTHRVADNVIGVLDSIGLLSILRAASKAGKAAGAAGEAADAAPLTGGGGPARRPTWERDWREGRQAEPGVYNQDGQSSYAVAPTSTEVDARNWHRNFATTDVQPTSPSQVIRDANPDMARRLHLAVEQDVDGTLANAAYGTSRQDAVAHDIAPQVAGVDGSVSSKVSHPEKASDFEMMVNSEILDFVDNSGAAWLTPSEKRVLRSNVVNDFQNAVGMVNRKEMTTIDALDDGVKFSSVYGPSDSGWSSLKAATDQAQYALREYGITPDAVKILVRDGDTYKPVSYDDAVSLITPQRVRRTVDVEQDTRGTGARYHGTTSNLDGGLSGEYAFSGSDKNIYGSGFYTTDAYDVARGYSKKGGGVENNVYSIKERGDVKLFNMEAPLNDEINTILGKVLPKDLDLDGVTNLREVYDALRSQSRDLEMSRADVRDAFDTIRDRLEELGYQGFTHLGGKNTGAAEHSVNIYWNPQDSLDISRAERPTRKVDTEVEIPAQKDLNGDFLLRIEHDYKFDSSTLERDGFEALDVKNNFVDRWFPGGGEGGHGTFQSSLLDPQSILNPKLTKGATIGGLRGAQLEQKLLQSIQPYVKAVKAMNKQEQGRLFDKIKEANYKGETFNYTNLRAEGFTENQITALSHWKEAQDTLYHISNRDLVKTYRTRGYGLMVDESTGTRLLVKDLPKGSVSETVAVFDPITDSVKKMDKETLARHYEAGGTVARTASPLSIDGVSVTHVLNQNKPGSTFIRSLNHTDTLLNYRKGYYAVRYKDPHFIEKRVLDEDGKPLLNASGQEMWRAVATAANIPDAKKAIERLSVTSGGEYRFRNNLKGEDFDLAEGQSMIAGGMSAQRVRGQRLEEALGNFNVSEAAHIESPMESLIRSIASISERVSMRDYMETAKRRFVAQFDDVLPRQNGQAIYPKTRSEIGREGMKNSKMAADARSTWEYLRQLENGYINIIDDGWKASFNAVADIMGHRGFGTSEANLRSVGKAGPSQVAKATAFNLLIAANPIRQFLIQSHQVLMLGANFPRYTFMHMADDITLMSVFALGGKPSKALLKFSGRTEQEAEAMWKALSNSGISAGISKHDFVQQSLTGVADAAAAARRSVAGSVASKAYTGTGAVFRGLRKVGFDAGEWISSSASFLAHYDEAVRAGRKMSQEAIDDITTKSRNYVFNMDKAGAMPWNHNSWAIITQFIQQPYKAILQFTTNRQLTTYEKLRTATFMVMMFGTHSIIGAAPKFESIFENYMNELLPEDGVWREAILRGVESLALNTLFTKMYGEKVELDYSSISPLDSYGLFEFMSNISDKGIREIIAGTPSGSLLFGTNPRLMNLAKSLTTMMGISASKYDGDPVGWSNVAKDAAGLLSGASNAMKAAYALEYGRKIGALGGTTDSRVNSFEAIAQVLGIQTLDEKRSREIMDATWSNAEKMKQDVQLVFSQVARHMTQDGITPDQFEYVVAMSQAMMSSFKGNPVALDEFRRLMNKQAADKNYGMMNTILTQCGFMSRGDMLKLINKVPNITEEQRRNLIEVCNASTPLDKR